MLKMLPTELNASDGVVKFCRSPSDTALFDTARSDLARVLDDLEGKSNETIAFEASRWWLTTYFDRAKAQCNKDRHLVNVPRALVDEYVKHFGLERPPTSIFAHLKGVSGDFFVSPFGCWAECNTRIMNKDCMEDGEVSLKSRCHQQGKIIQQLRSWEDYTEFEDKCKNFGAEARNIEKVDELFIVMVCDPPAELLAYMHFQRWWLVSDNDAWGAIRGFYYQFQLTVKRLLELTTNEVLLLECTEDLARFSQDFSDGAAQGTIVFEQHKHIDPKKTLSFTHEAFTKSFAHFCGHILRRKERAHCMNDFWQGRVKYLFITSTNSIADDLRPWMENSTGNGKLFVSDVELIHERLSERVSCVAKTKGVTESDLEAYVSVIHEHSVLVHFIKMFNIQIGQSIRMLKDEINLSIQKRFPNVNPADASLKLLAFVIQSCSEEGEKLVTAQDVTEVVGAGRKTQLEYGLSEFPWAPFEAILPESMVPGPIYTRYKRMLELLITRGQFSNQLHPLKEQIISKGFLTKADCEKIESIRAGGQGRIIMAHWNEVCY